MEISADRAAAGADLARPRDALFINAPLRDYSLRPRVNDFTLPVLGMGYIATYANPRASTSASLRSPDLSGQRTH